VSWFARIEEACAAFIERAFANMFPSDLEPAQIARKLVATMEARSYSDETGLRAPGKYRVFVSAADFARLSPHKTYLQHEWTELLRQVAERVGIRFQSDGPTVEMVEDPGVVTGGIEIDVVNGAQEQRFHVQQPIFVLRLMKGMPVNAVFAIDGATRIGRSRESDIFLVDPSVSRNHALLDVREGNLVVRDAGSTNGTFVNGERVQLRTLRPGDRVAFGKTEMLVERGEP
jgi:FHA domain/Protein of unknown function (DUF3662)